MPHRLSETRTARSRAATIPVTWGARDPLQFRTKRPRQAATNAIGLEQKARTSRKPRLILPLTTVWLQVRVLPGFAQQPRQIDPSSIFSSRASSLSMVGSVPSSGPFMARPPMPDDGSAVPQRIRPRCSSTRAERSAACHRHRHVRSHAATGKRGTREHKANGEQEKRKWFHGSHSTRCNDLHLKLGPARRPAAHDCASRSLQCRQDSAPKASSRLMPPNTTQPSPASSAAESVRHEYPPHRRYSGTAHGGKRRCDDIGHSLQEQRVPPDPVGASGPDRAST